MEFGLFSNGRRPDCSLGEAWDADIAEVVTADRLGFKEAWFSEHQTPAELIIAKAAALTQRIRMGSGVRPLAYYHPLQVALEANATDQLTNGRYMLGIGTGFQSRNMEWRGLDPAMARPMMEAAIELILRLWDATGPVDYDGPFWTGRQMVLQAPPVQRPHPPVAIAAVNSASSVELAGRLGLKVLTGDFIPVDRLRRFGQVLLEHQERAGRRPDRSLLQTTRMMYVAETDRQARDDMRESYARTIAWEIANTPHHQVQRIPPGGSLDDITFDYLVDTGNLFVGSPQTVVARIEEHWERSGGFGMLMFHAGRDYGTGDQRRRSMELFAEEVAPHVRHLTVDTDRETRPMPAAAAE